VSQYGLWRWVQTNVVATNLMWRQVQTTWQTKHWMDYAIMQYAVCSILAMQHTRLPEEAAGSA
jgi:hypothetical protein